MSNQAASENDFVEHVISLPGIHCAGCISKIERGLHANADVKTARVNLSLKRVRVLASKTLPIEKLISEIAGIGFDGHVLNLDNIADRGDIKDGQGLLLRLGIAGFAMMNVMLLSISVWAGADSSTRDLLHIVSALIAIPVVAYCAQPFFRNAWRALRVRKLNMDVPISLAILLAVGMSLFETIVGGEDAYFDAALSLTFFLLIGRYLDYRTRASARSAAAELSALEVSQAIRIEDGKEVLRELKLIEIGDIVRILPGSRVPVEGEVVLGASDIDESVINGESMPRAINLGDALFSGTMNLTGPIDIRVSAIGANTTLRKMSQLIEIAESARTKYTSLADKAAAIYAPVVHLLAFAGFLVWFWVSGDFRMSMNVAIATLIITCPCALGLAVPAVNTAASGRLFEKNILLKSETALERLAEITQIAFDKTGTLTEGAPRLERIEGEGDLSIAYALAGASKHPLAMSLAAEFSARDIKAAALTDIKETPGFGMSGKFEKIEYKLGRANWLGLDEVGASTASYFGEGKNITRFAFSDNIRAEAADVMTSLTANGLSPILLSGDSDAPVQQVARELGMDDYVAAMTPESKVAKITELQSEGGKVLMVGDGFNDTAALAVAHVSMAPASATDATRAASDIVFIGNDLNAVTESHKIARAARARILENFALAAIYNAIAIPFAMLGYASPIAAALAMSSSSIIVVLNAQRVRWMK